MVELIPQAGEILLKIFDLATQVLLPCFEKFLCIQVASLIFFHDAPFLFVDIMTQLIKKLILNDELVLKMLGLS